MTELESARAWAAALEQRLVEVRRILVNGEVDSRIAAGSPADRRARIRHAIRLIDAELVQP